MNLLGHLEMTTPYLISEVQNITINFRMLKEKKMVKKYCKNNMNNEITFSLSHGEVELVLSLLYQYTRMKRLFNIGSVSRIAVRALFTCAYSTRASLGLLLNFT